MLCPFCAETIQDQAVVCRYCGAVKSEGGWVFNPSASRSDPPPGNLTLRSAGAFFLVSAAFQIYSIRTEAPLFGALRAGPAAWIYNGAWAAMFIAMGVGLLLARPWGLKVTLAGTGIYTIDRLIYLLDRAAREAQLKRITADYPDVLSVLDRNQILQLSTLVTVGTLACWWGFAIYAYLRRSSFRPASKAASMPRGKTF